MNANGSVLISTLPAEVSWDNVSTPHEELLEKLDAIGLAEYCPTSHSVTEALKATLTEYGRRWKRMMRNDPHGGDVTFSVQGHKNRRKNGFQFNKVVERRVKNDNVPLFSAYVGDEDELVRISDGEFPGSFLNDLQIPFNRFRRSCSATSVGQALKRILYDRFQATATRASGGTYFVPNDVLEEFENVVKPIFESFGNVIHISRVILDANEIRKIMISITEELVKDIEALESDIRDNDYRKDTLIRRKLEADSIRRKAESYEPILDQQLTKVREALAAADDAYVTAIASEEDNEIFSFAS